MFLIMGINQSKKSLPFSEQTVCENCGRLSRFEGYMTYMNFNLFFIPLFKWHHKCFVEASCCGAVYEIGNEHIAAFRHGEINRLEPEMIHLVYAGQQHDAIKLNCQSCGYVANNEFVYCPKCGNPLRR